MKLYTEYLGYKIEVGYDGYQWYFGDPDTYDADWDGDGYRYYGIHSNIDHHRDALRELVAEIKESVEDYTVPSDQREAMAEAVSLRTRKTKQAAVTFCEQRSTHAMSDADAAHWGKVNHWVKTI